jgi:hypothetical protein
MPSRFPQLANEEPDRAVPEAERQTKEKVDRRAETVVGGISIAHQLTSQDKPYPERHACDGNGPFPAGQTEDDQDRHHENAKYGHATDL